MKEIIERAEKLGYKRWFKFWHITELSEDQFYIELCLIQKWLREDKKVYVWVEPFVYLVDEKTFYRWYLHFYDEIDNYEEYKSEGVIDTLFNKGQFSQALEEGIKKALEILEKL